jgi:hypothetical protein
MIEYSLIQGKYYFIVFYYQKSWEIVADHNMGNRFLSEIKLKSQAVTQKRGH